MSTQEAEPRTRRVNGEGSKPFQRPGRKGWYSRIRATDPRTGEYRRVLVSAPTKTELARKVKEARDGIEAGSAPATRRGTAQTVEAYAAVWSATHLEERDVTPSTRRLYRHALNNFVLPAVGGLRLDKVREGDVKAMDRRLREADKSTASRRLAYNVARMVFADAVGDKLIRVNPAEGVKRPADPPKPQPRYTVGQVKDLQAAVKDDRIFEDLVALMLWTALRPGEALALQWDAVDLDEKILTVRATLAQDAEGRVYRQPFAKGMRDKDKQPRVVPLVPPAVKALKAARARRAAERLEVGEAWEDNGLVFSDELGRLLDDRNLRRRYGPMVKGVGLDGSFHALRRSTATLLTKAKVPLGVVAAILGHSSTAVTVAHYAVTDTEMMEMAFSDLEAFWEAQA